MLTRADSSSELARAFDARRQRVGKESKVGAECDCAIPLGHPILGPGQVTHHHTGRFAVPVARIRDALDRILERGR